MAWTQSDLDAIKQALVSDRRRVQFNGRMVEYRSVDEMLSAKAAIELDLAQQSAASNGISRPRGYRARTSKGY